MESLKKSILAVDDTPASLKIIHGALSGEFSLHLAKSGGMAMSTLENTTVDLILLDIEMPGISGFDIIDLLKKKPNLKDIPVIFVTSHATSDFVVEAAKRGAKDYLAKPYTPDLLRDKVHKALETEASAARGSM
ncbi:MAG: response regulator [Oscillospiraceae bacterium]|jgi:putative two-component system response regulator|nr:response regulator [Oscillospiraceae bacterium]